MGRCYITGMPCDCAAQGRECQEDTFPFLHEEVQDEEEEVRNTQELIMFDSFIHGED